MYSYIAKSVFNDQLGSSTDPCYIQNRAITNRVIKRLRCTCLNPLIDEVLTSIHNQYYEHLKNIAKSEQSSHTPGGSHQRPL